MIIFFNNIKGTRIQSQFRTTLADLSLSMENLFFMSKITVTKKNVSKLCFKYYIGDFDSYNNMSQMPINPIRSGLFQTVNDPGGGGL